MSDRPKRVALLGSTGSIGCSALEVIAAAPARFEPVVLSAHCNVELLADQARRFRPRMVIVTDGAAAERLDRAGLSPETLVAEGIDAVVEAVAADDVDVVVSAIVGSAGLRGTWAAVEAGKTVALANKESLVHAGPLVTRLAAERGATLLPVDSEHSAIFQALQAGRREELRRVVLTASGGPFRTYSAEQLARVTVDDALAHPTWSMGRKITIDSATLMNKALEIIEARWLFDLDAGQIDVVIHPQSIVHSMVEFCDGSVIAQLSPPDMKLPIQYALTYPDRTPGVAERLDFTQAMTLEFHPPDASPEWPERFDAIRLGLEVAERGGTAGAVLGGANEAAVASFLDGRLPFDRIVPACRAVLENHDFDPNPSLEQLERLDTWAREEMNRWIAAS